MNDSKPFYTSKLFWLGAVTLLAPVLEWATGQDVISGNPWALFVIGALTVLFRSVTTNAIRILPLLLLALCFVPEASAQIVGANHADVLRRALPPTTDPKLDAILRDSSTLLYTEAEMPQLFQRGGAFRRVVRGNRNDGNDEFPWRTAGGVHRSAGIGSFRFLSLPKSSNGVRWPVIIVQQKLDERDQQAGLVWYFPVGAVIGEVLTMRSPAGVDYTFEIRTREREADDWGVEIYRPFPTASSLAEGIRTLRPSWGSEPTLRDAVARLESPKALVSQNLTDRRLHPGFVLNVNEAVDELPALDSKLVAELLLAATFEPASAEFWRHGSNGQAAFAPTVRQGFSIVPVNYDAAFLGNSRESCINCHRNTGAQSVRFDPTWSGHIRGSDGIFSFHPVSLDSINQTPPRLRRELVEAGIIARFDPAIHPESVYSSIPKLRHVK